MESRYPLCINNDDAGRNVKTVLLYPDKLESKKNMESPFDQDWIICLRTRTDTLILFRWNRVWKHNLDLVFNINLDRETSVPGWNPPEKIRSYL